MVDADLTSLTEETNPSSTDVAYNVIDPSGARNPRKSTWANILKIWDTLTSTISGVKTFGSAGDTGKLKIAGNTSGAITVEAPAVAGTGTVTLPASGTVVAQGGALGTPSSGTLTSCTGLPLGGLVATTANRVLESNGTGVISPSAVTSTTLSYLDATSSIQTQINGKVTSGGALGTPSSGTLTNCTGLPASSITRTINAQTGTSYTGVLSDAGAVITLSNASAITFTIPPNSSVAYPIGTVLDLIQIGAGQVTISQGSGVTITSVGATPSAPKCRVQHSGASAIKTATDTWRVVGDIA